VIAAATKAVIVAARSQKLRAASGGLASRGELLWLAVLLLGLNLPLFTGGSVEALAFDGNAVGAGEWWRLFTHPFVHVSGYHFILDGAAFLSLWSMISGGFWRRVRCSVCSIGAALLVSLVWSEAIWRVGLCGLSGVAHGLAACVALDQLCQSGGGGRRIAPALALTALCGKVAFELYTGGLAWSGWHLGELGTPIVTCHAGGLLGAIVRWLVEQGATPPAGAQLFTRLFSAQSHSAPAASYPRDQERSIEVFSRDQPSADLGRHGMVVAGEVLRERVVGLFQQLLMISDVQRVDLRKSPASTAQAAAEDHVNNLGSLEADFDRPHRG
jgi:membrane associated rhomboid family serine protease